MQNVGQKFEGKPLNFDEDIAPLLLQINKVCKLKGVPYFATFAVDNSDGVTTYKSNGASPYSLGLELYDDHINRHLLILQGNSKFCIEERKNGEYSVVPAQVGDWDDDVMMSLNDG